MVNYMAKPVFKKEKKNVIIQMKEKIKKGDKPEKFQFKQIFMWHENACYL